MSYSEKQRQYNDKYDARNEPEQMDNYSYYGKAGKRWIFELWHVVLNTMCISVDNFML